MLLPLLPFPSSRCNQFATAPFAAVGSVEIIGARAARGGAAILSCIQRIRALLAKKSSQKKIDLEISSF